MNKNNFIYTYILLSQKDGQLYTGFTRNLGVSLKGRSSPACRSLGAGRALRGATLVLGIIFFLFLSYYPLLTTNYQLVEASTIKPPVINLGLTAHWTFDGKNIVNGAMIDASGNSNTGNFVSIATSTFYTDGVLGQAGKLNGSTQYVSTPLVTNYTAVTSSSWVKFDSLSNSYQATVSTNVSGSGQASDWIQWYYTGGQSDVLFRSGGVTFVNENVSWVPSLNTWYFLTTTWDSAGDGKVRFYVDGAIKHTSTGSSNTAMTGSAKVLIGALQWADTSQNSIVGSQALAGTVDDVRIYNRALTTAEIKRLYNMGRPVKVTATRKDQITSGLVGYYPLDGADVSGLTVYDRSGQGRNGTIVGGSATTLTDGIIGQGINFTTNTSGGGANSSSVDLSSQFNSLFTTTQDFSISLWAKVRGDGYLFGSYWNGSPIIRYSSPNLLVGNTTSGAGSVSYTNYLNTWSHIVWTHSDTSGNNNWLYVNGVLVSGPTVQNQGALVNYTSIGERRGFFPPAASVDEVRIYNRTLSASEAKRLYVMGRPAVVKANYLLDNIPNAAAAYSVRKLRSTYSGYAMKVRRDSDNATQDIGFSGINLNTSSLLSFCGAGSCYVDTWYDQSGNGRNTVQATTANQPQIVSSGALLTGSNGRPKMTFDGSTDYLMATWTQAQPETVMLVFNPISWTSADGVFDGTTFNTMRLLQYPSTGSYQIYAGALVPAVSFATGSWSLVTATFAGASSELRKNGDTASAGNAGSSGGGGLVLGSSGDLISQCSNISVSEAIVWPSDLSSGDEGAARTNANNYFRIY
ncbi:MAG: LamG-like jellyroll fold domain-containing protein [Candidatus Paceibacterota bacterium]